MNTLNYFYRDTSRFQQIFKKKYNINIYQKSKTNPIAVLNPSQKFVREKQKKGNRRNENKSY